MFHGLLLFLAHIIQRRIVNCTFVELLLNAAEVAIKSDKHQRSIKGCVDATEDAIEDVLQHEQIVVHFSCLLLHQQGHNTKQIDEHGSDSQH